MRAALPEQEVRMKNANHGTQLQGSTKHKKPAEPAAQTGKNPKDARDDEAQLEQPESQPADRLGCSRAAFAEAVEPLLHVLPAVDFTPEQPFHECECEQATATRMHAAELLGELQRLARRLERRGQLSRPEFEIGEPQELLLERPHVAGNPVLLHMAGEQRACRLALAGDREGLRQPADERGIGDHLGALAGPPQRDDCAGRSGCEPRMAPLGNSRARWTRSSSSAEPRR